MPAQRNNASKKIMAWYGRRRVRRYRRYGRRRYRRGFGRRRYSRRRSRSTRSSTVKLTREFSFQFRTGTTSISNNAFTFVPTDIPGFVDYLNVYTHFRIKKAVLHVSVDPVTHNNYLVVPSSPFASTMPPVLDTDPQNPASYLSTIAEERLRQSRWQRVLYPNNTRIGITVPFMPYTMIATHGPSSAANTQLWQRIWPARKWMPLTWAYGYSASAAQSLTFYGPFVLESSVTDRAWTPSCTLTVYLQFRGQK